MCADAAGRRFLNAARAQGRQHHGTLAQPRARTQQRVELARGFELLDPAEGGERALAGFAALTAVLDDLQVSAIAGGLDAEEHAALHRDTATLMRFAVRKTETALKLRQGVAPQIKHNCRCAVFRESAVAERRVF
jgi:hypothetical protein